MAPRISIVTLALAAALAGPALSAEVTLSYEGVVTEASGAQAGLFSAGQEISVTYTVETTAPDVDPNPGNGVYHGGLLSLRITIPAAGVDAQVGTGTVQTFDNEPGANSDQVFFYGDATAGSLAGSTLVRAEVDFLDYEPGPAGFPIMLSSPAIPTDALVTDDSFAIFYTAAGTTFVDFLVEPDAPTPAGQVEDARRLVQDLVDAGELRPGLGNALDSKLAGVLAGIESGNTARACGSLRAFDNQVRALERSGRLDPASAAELRALADSLSATLGC